MRIKRANLPKLSQCHFRVRSTLGRSVSKVAVTSISGLAENVNARRLFSERRINKALHGWSIIQFPLDHSTPQQDTT